VIGLAHHMSNSTGGISLLWCAACNQERPHKRGVCSCGTKHEAYPVRDLASKWVSRSMTIVRKRKRWNGSEK
jgi:hypothetical protein